jgi:DNA-binding PadR family transcriptional regulator
MTIPMSREGPANTGATVNQSTNPPQLPSISTVCISTVDIIGRMSAQARPESLLPLPPAVFHILMALADEDRHGYAIIQEVRARTGGEVRLGPGTLYRSIQRMLDDDLIVEVAERPAPELDDERRRYYRITPFGRAVARAEANRLQELVRLARASGFTTRKA